MPIRPRPLKMTHAESGRVPRVLGERLSAFNATNHPRFGSTTTDPISLKFGQVSLSTVNQSRIIELGGKLYF